MNVITFIRVVLLVVIFLTATYWFFDLINSNLFNFAAPLAKFITGCMHHIYNQDIEIGGVSFDGTLLLFDIFALIVIFVLVKLKPYIQIVDDKIDDIIGILKKNDEKRFNNVLKNNVEKDIAKNNNVAILIELQVKNMLVDSFWGGNPDEGMKENLEEAVTQLYTAIKLKNYCDITKSDGKLLVLFSDFNKIDDVLSCINSAKDKTDSQLKKKKWKLITYIAMGVYSNNKELGKVYNITEKLIRLKIPDEMLCLGDFNIRYGLLAQKEYQPVLKGVYTFAERCEVWSLVKKN